MRASDAPFRKPKSTARMPAASNAADVSPYSRRTTKPIAAKAMPPHSTLGIRMEKKLKPNNLPQAANWRRWSGITHRV